MSRLSEPPPGIAILREAASLIRSEWDEPAQLLYPDDSATHLAVADWLDAEAQVLGEMEPFAELLNVVIQRKGGPESYIRFGRNDDGSPAMSLDTSPAALAVARAYLDRTPA